MKYADYRRVDFLCNHKLLNPDLALSAFLTIVAETGGEERVNLLINKEYSVLAQKVHQMDAARFRQ